MANSADWRGTAIERMLGCFPLISEEGRSDPAYRDWYCAARPAGTRDAGAFIEFAIRRELGARRFSMLIGELGGACPAPRTIAATAAPRLRRGGAAGMFTGTRRFMGEIGVGPDRVAVLSCAYIGRQGPNYQQATLAFTYDAKGYHIHGPIEEVTFDPKGEVIGQSPP